MANLSSVPECVRALQGTVLARERALPPFFCSRYCNLRKFVDVFLIKRQVKSLTRKFLNRKSPL
jgi:hypothetical protein